MTVRQVASQFCRLGEKSIAGLWTWASGENGRKQTANDMLRNWLD
ncbi:hypothetical protein SAMN05216420_11353 [Nitrosospira sp. Nl5]|nr:hypothetical protein SAMN05216420_11353 [Nitrosospira sp. Nl5]